MARYRQLLAKDVEAGESAALGRLEVLFYQPHAKGQSGEPDQSHLKLTIVDEEIAVFGSGNMDRPSWFTSQELGIAFFSPDFVAQTRASLAEALEGRTKLFFDSVAQR